jgi:hypothetical protein
MDFADGGAFILARARLRSRAKLINLLVDDMAWVDRKQLAAGGVESSQKCGTGEVVRHGFVLLRRTAVAVSKFKIHRATRNFYFTQQSIRHATDVLVFE